MYRMLVVLIVLALAILIFGCGGSTGTDTTAATTVPTTAAPSVTTAPAAAVTTAPPTTTTAMPATTVNTPTTTAVTPTTTIQNLSYDALATAPEDATIGFDGTVVADYGLACVIYFADNEDQPVHVITTMESGGFHLSAGRKVHVIAHPRGTSDKYAADFSLQELPRVLAVEVKRL